MAERIISADSHFEIPVERVAEYLPQKHKDAYAEVRAGMMEQIRTIMGDPSAQPQLRNKPQGAARAPEVPRPSGQAYPAEGRPGASDPTSV